MAVVTWELGRAALVDWLTVVLAILSTLVVLRFQVNSAWLVVVGGLVGVLAQLVWQLCLIRVQSHFWSVSISCRLSFR